MCTILKIVRVKAPRVETKESGIPGSAGSYCGFASFFGGETGLQRTAGEKKIGKIAKRIVLDLTFDGRMAKIAIIKYYSVTLAEFSSKMPMKQPK